MRKFFFIAALAALMCTATEAKAQTAAEVDATVAKVMSAKAPCNQGPEDLHWQILPGFGIYGIACTSDR